MVDDFTMSDTVPVIVGAAIGAGGAIIGQITASMFTARRERARLAWEQERQQRDWDIRETERFFGLRHELYAAYYGVCRQAIDYVYQEDNPESPPPFGKPIAQPDGEELDRLRSSIALVAPHDVSRRVDEAYGRVSDAVFLGMNPAAATDRERLEAIGAAGVAVDAAFQAMRADSLAERGGLRQFGRSAPG